MTEPSTPKRPDPPPLPTIPVLADLPRESAVETVAVAAQILANVQKWAPAAVEAVDFMGAADLRRKLAPIAVTIYRRALSKAAALDAQEALRRVERVSGLTALEGQKLGLVRPQRQGNKAPGMSTREIGLDTNKAYPLAAPTEEEFEAAIQRGRDRGSLAFDNLLGALGEGQLTEVQQAQRDRLAELAADRFSTAQIAEQMDMGARNVAALAKRYGIEILGDAGITRARSIDPIRVITESIPTLDGVGAAAKQVDLADIAGLDPAQAKDWARQMWDALTPTMALRAALRNRGKEA